MATPEMSVSVSLVNKIFLADEGISVGEVAPSAIELEIVVAIIESKIVAATVATEPYTIVAEVHS